MLEPDEGKLSRPVLRGGGGSNAVSLPDKTLRRFRQTSTRMNCITVPQIAAATCLGFWTKCCVLPAYRVNHETEPIEEPQSRLFSIRNNSAGWTAVKMEAYV